MSQIADCMLCAEKPSIGCKLNCFSQEETSEIISTGLPGTSNSVIPKNHETGSLCSMSQHNCCVTFIDLAIALLLSHTVAVGGKLLHKGISGSVPSRDKILMIVSLF